MAVSTILNITQIAENQANKYVTHNDAINAIVEATNKPYNNTSVGTGPINVSDADATRYFVYRLSGASAAFNFVMPAVVNSVNAKRVFVVRNENTNTAYVATVKASTGSGATVTVQPGSAALVLQDHEDMYVLSVGSTSTVPYDIGFFISGKPAASAIVMQFSAVRAFTLPGNLSGSKGRINTNATSTLVLDLQKNGVSTGSISISNVGVFTFATTSGNPVSFAAGDYLTVVAPNPQDATGADINVNIAGTRSLL